MAGVIPPPGHRRLPGKTMVLTSVALQEYSDGHRHLIFGTAECVDQSRRGPVALFRPGRIVAYLIQRRRHRALYLFRTVADFARPTTIDGVSAAVDLLLVASTCRAVRRARTAIRAIARRTAERSMEGLRDIFWFRLAELIVGPGHAEISSAVADLLRREMEQQ